MKKIPKIVLPIIISTILHILLSILSIVLEEHISKNDTITKIIDWSSIYPVHSFIILFIAVFLIMFSLEILNQNKTTPENSSQSIVVRDNYGTINQTQIKQKQTQKAVFFTAHAIRPVNESLHSQIKNHLDISNKILNRTTYGIDITNISNDVIENCTVTLEHIEAVYSLHENKIDKGILFGSSQSYRGKLRWKEKEFNSNHCEEKLIAGETKTVQILDSYTIKIDGTYTNNKASISEIMQFVYCSNQTAINEATRLINGLYKIKLRVDGIQSEKYVTPYYYDGYIFIKVEQENPNNIKNSTFIGDGDPRKNKSIPRQSIFSKLFKLRK